MCGTTEFRELTAPMWAKNPRRSYTIGIAPLRRLDVAAVTRFVPLDDSGLGPFIRSRPYVFSSCFNSLRKRQFVCSAMIRFGTDLMNPASFSRSE